MNGTDRGTPDTPRPPKDGRAAAPEAAPEPARPEHGRPDIGRHHPHANAGGNAEPAPSHTAGEGARRRPSRRAKFWSVGALLATALAVGTMGLLRSHGTRTERERQMGLEQKGPLVETVRVRETLPVRELKLIGESRPYSVATLYARIAGYVRDVRVDKGAVVHAGDLLATIESPETDKAYRSAAADARNKRRIAARMRALRARNLVSPQEAEQAFTNADIAEQTLQTQATLRGYESVRAPFDGTITDRLVDPGALNGNGGSLALMTISQLDRLRVFVYVDQREAPFIRPGDPVEIRVPERPESPFVARVARISGQLDPKARSLLTEIELPNAERRVIPGSFVEARLTVRVPQYAMIPVDALITVNGPPRAAVIESGRVQMRELRIGENDGQNVQVVSGVRPGEQVALALGVSLRQGQTVQVHAGGNGASEKSDGTQAAGAKGEDKDKDKDKGDDASNVQGQGQGPGQNQDQGQNQEPARGQSPDHDKGQGQSQGANATQRSSQSSDLEGSSDSGQGRHGMKPAKPEKRGQESK